MRLHPLSSLPAAFILLGIAGCTVGPDYTPPKADVPAMWSATAPKNGKPTSVVTLETQPVDTWWLAFNDAELTSLIDRAGTANLDLRQAALRVTEALKQRGVADTHDLPTVGLDSSYTRTLISPNGALSLFGSPPPGSAPAAGSAFPAFGANIPPFDLFQSGFDASWELDLFGKVRRSVEAADAQIVAATEDRNDVLLSVYAAIARYYFQLRSLQDLIRITEDNLKSQQQAYDLTHAQASGGEASNLDVESASAEVASTAAQLPALQDQQRRTINALSHLLGREPGALEAELIAVKPIPAIPSSVPIGLPADLVRRRPDIRRAEAQLHMATAEIGIATADLFPRLTLQGSFGLQALRFNKLDDWASRFYNFGPSLSIPVFNGTTYANISLQETRQQEAALSYESTVLSALHDVENSVSSYGTEQVRLRSLEQASTANRHSLDLARQRYRAGLSSFLDVLDAERRVYASDIDVANSTLSISINLVAVYKALGGGWETAAAAPDAAKSGRRRRPLAFSVNLSSWIRSAKDSSDGAAQADQKGMRCC